MKSTESNSSECLHVAGHPDLWQRAEIYVSYMSILIHQEVSFLFERSKGGQEKYIFKQII